VGALAPERWAEVGAKARVAWMGVLVPVAVALEVAATVPASQEVGVAIAASSRYPYLGFLDHPNGFISRAEA